MLVWIERLQPLRTRESQLFLAPSPCRMDFAHMYQVYKSRRGIKRSEDSKVGASLDTPFPSPSRAPGVSKKSLLVEGWLGDSRCVELVVTSE